MNYFVLIFAVAHRIGNPDLELPDLDGNKRYLKQYLYLEGLHKTKLVIVITITRKVFREKRGRRTLTICDVKM